LASHLQPVFARSSITKTRNRSTIPALLLNQNERRRTKSERQIGKLLRTHSLGHTVRLIAPQFVKPFVKSNKNDDVDAEAICEAIQHSSMRFVSSKNFEQQDIQSLHRIRSQTVTRRAALSNQIRGLLMEYGVVIFLKGSHTSESRFPWSLRIETMN